MYKKILLTACVAVLLSGCLGKKANPVRYYEMTYKGEVCKHKSQNPSFKFSR